MYKKIVVPLDGSSLSEVVLQHVRELATRLGSEIVLLQVLTHASYDYLLTSATLSAQLRESEEAQACEYLTQQMHELKQGGLEVSADVITATGPVAEAIVAFSQTAGADLIAMSTHGRTGPARWLLGSVADRVVRSAQIPVLLIHPHPAPETTPHEA